MSSEDGGKMCERRADGWYCVSLEDYQLDKFENALRAEEYPNEDESIT